MFCRQDLELLVVEEFLELPDDGEILRFVLVQQGLNEISEVVIEFFQVLPVQTSRTLMVRIGKVSIIEMKSSFELVR